MHSTIFMYTYWMDALVYTKCVFLHKDLAVYVCLYEIREGKYWRSNKESSSIIFFMRITVAAPRSPFPRWLQWLPTTCLFSSSPTNFLVANGDFWQRRIKILLVVASPSLVASDFYKRKWNKNRFLQNYYAKSSDKIKLSNSRTCAEKSLFDSLKKVALI